MVQLKSSTQWIGVVVALVLLTATAFAGEVTDTLLTTQTWTVDNSPYVITHDVSIPAGETLTIDPGVTVEFDGPYSFNVVGVLNARGQAGGNSLDDVLWVTFTQDTTGLDMDQRWKGIRFQDSDPGSFLQWAIIEFGYANGRWPANNGGGLYVYGSSPRIEGVIVRDCHADNNGGGIYFWSSSSVFQNNLIVNNSAVVNGGGVYVDQSDLDIRNNTLVGNYAVGDGNDLRGIGQGMFVGPQANLVIRSSIFWANGDNPGSGDDEAYFISGINEVDIRYCIVSDLADDNAEDFLYAERAYFEEELYYTLSDSSVGIDAGDPSDDRVGSEPSPHGQYVNIGAWGGTQYASKSVPVAVPQAANGDRSNLVLYPTTRVSDTTSASVGIGNIGHDDLRFYLDENSRYWVLDSLHIDGVEGDARRAYINHRFTLPSNIQFEIAADSTDAFDVLYHPDPSDTERLEVWLKLETNGGDLLYRLRGTPVNPGIELSTTSIDFGTVQLGDSVGVEYQISSTGTTELELTSPHLATLTDHFGSDRPSTDTPWTLEPGETYTYIAYCKPIEIVGNLRDSIFVRNNDQLLYIRLRAFVEGPLLETNVEDGDTIDFLFADINSETQDFDVILYNDGNADMTVSQPVISGASFSTEPSTFPQTVEPDDTLRLKLVFDPDQVQLYNETIAIPTTLETINLSLTGRGTTGGRYFSGSIPNPEYNIPEVWGSDGVMTYICAGPNVIDPAEKLTILEGVEIQFEDTLNWMEVRGTLEILGTEDNPVRFKPQGSLPYHLGLRFVACNTQTRIEHTIVENGRTRTMDEDEEEIQPDYTLHGGGIAVYNCSPTLYKVTVRNCESLKDAGGIWIFQSAPTIIGCTIENNIAATDGGGITMWGSRPTFHNSKILDNVAGGSGGGIYFKSYCDPIIGNVLIQDNEATRGGGIYASDHSSPIILNSILYSNEADTARALRSVSRSNPILRNCVIHGHGDGAIEHGTNGSAVIRYSMVEGMDDATNHVFDAEPTAVFVDTVDFELNGSSSSDNLLIDGGNPGSQYEDYSFPPSKGTMTNDIGLYGGQYAGYWDNSAPLRIRFLPNLVNARNLYILVSTLQSGLGTPSLEVKSYTGTENLTLTEVSSGSGMYSAQYTTEESIYLEFSASLDDFLFRKNLSIAVYKPATGSTLSDPSGARLIMPPNALVGEVMMTGDLDLGASLPDEVPLAAPAGGRWQVDCAATFWSEPAEIILPYDAETIHAGREDGLAIWRLTDENRWEKLESYVDVDAKTVHASAYGPGMFAVVNNPQGGDSKLLPVSSQLGANYPNPFNPSTTIPFALNTASRVELQVFNVLGQHVGTAAQGWFTAGQHAVHWNGRSLTGGELASGVYFYRLVVHPANGDAKLVQTRKLVLMR